MRSLSEEVRALWRAQTYNIGMVRLASFVMMAAAYSVGALKLGGAPPTMRSALPQMVATAPQRVADEISKDAPLKVLIAHSRDQGSRREMNEDERLVRLFVVVPKSLTGEVPISTKFRKNLRNSAKSVLLSMRFAFCPVICTGFCNVI